MTKRPLVDPFSDAATLLFQPAFNLIGTVLGFPLLQRLVITAFGVGKWDANQKLSPTRT